jgi:hypothetical protein
MVWTDGLTNYSNGNVPTHTELNAYLDNLSWLNAPPTDNYAQTVDTDITTTSDTWVQISADFALSVDVAEDANVLLILDLVTELLEVDIQVDGTRLGSAPATTGDGITNSASGGINQPTLIIRPIFGLSAGVHTFTAVMKRTSGTGRIHGSSHPRFDAREM